MSVPEMSEVDRRLLHRAVLRNKYSKFAGDHRYGRCYSGTCKSFIRPWHRVASWNGHYWHAGCLSDEVFERMSTLTDNPAIAALLDEYVPPIRVNRWEPGMYGTHYEVAAGLVDPEKNKDMAVGNLQRRVHETALVAQVRATLALVDAVEKLHASYVATRDTTYLRKDSTE